MYDIMRLASAMLIALGAYWTIVYQVMGGLWGVGGGGGVQRFYMGVICLSAGLLLRVLWDRGTRPQRLYGIMQVASIILVALGANSTLIQPTMAILAGHGGELDASRFHMGEVCLLVGLLLGVLSSQGNRLQDMEAELTRLREQLGKAKGADAEE